MSRMYWVSYSTKRGSVPFFAVLKSDESGKKLLLTPPGHLSSVSDVVGLLFSAGIDLHEAADAVAEAIANGIASLEVKA